MKIMRHKLPGLAACALVAGAAAWADPIPFDRNWKEQGFLRLFTNDYTLAGTRLGVVSDGTVSLLWRPLDAAQWNSTAASWEWEVREGVAPTDLSRRGGDDRSLAVYFVFVDPARAEQLQGQNITRLLREDSVRAIIYVWGGDHPKGARLPSPYSGKMRTVVLQTARTGSGKERIDLRGDYRSLFSGEAGALVGIAVSADSDDTDGSIKAALANLTLR